MPNLWYGSSEYIPIDALIREYYSGTTTGRFCVDYGVCCYSKDYRFELEDKYRHIKVTPLLPTNITRD